MEKTVVAAVATAEDKTNEPTLQLLEGGSSAVSVEVSTDVAVEPSEERKRSVGSKDRVNQPCHIDHHEYLAIRLLPSMLL